MVGDGALVDDLAVLVEHAEGMLLVAEIKSDGDEWNFGGHGSVELITAIKCRRSLPSHLILLAFDSCAPPLTKLIITFFGETANPVD